MNNVAQLILTLINTHRHATDAELDQISAHVAQAPFSSRPLCINRWLRQELEARGLRVLRTGFQASSPETIFTEVFEHVRHHR